MKAKYTLLILVCIIAKQSTLFADDFSPSNFVDTAFTSADQQAQAIRADKNETDSSVKTEKIYAAYGSAIAQVIEKAMTDQKNRDALISSLKPHLKKIFSITTSPQETPEQITQAETLLGEAFEKYASTPKGYLAAPMEIINLIKKRYYANPNVRALIGDTFNIYLDTLLKEHDVVESAFANQSIQNATNQILTKEIKNKNPVDSRIIINALIDKLIEKTGAKTSQASVANDGKATIEQVTGWFKDANATTIDSMNQLIQQKLKESFTPEKMFLVLTTFRSLLSFALSPTPLPEATSWEAPPGKCPWYNLSCSIPWDKVGDGLKKAFSKDVWENKVGGGLKVAFVDNVYEKGLKKIAEVFDNNIINKPRDMAHSIASAINGVADQISNTPQTIRDKASQVIGKESTEDFTAAAYVSTSDLATQLAGGAQTLNKSITNILDTISTIKLQKENVIKQNLASKGITELKQLNTMLIGDAKTQGAFDAVIDALNELASADCKTGALCEIENAFKKATTEAKKNEQTIRNDIQELDRKINHPNLLQDKVLEPLPKRLHHTASLLNL